MLSTPHERLYEPKLPPVILNVNRAGSVGKTTYGLNAAVQAVVKRQLRGLFVDADLQSDASRWAGWDGDNVQPGEITVHDVMLNSDVQLAQAIVPARTRISWDADETGNFDRPENFQVIEGLDLVRGDAAMEQADSELASDPMAVLWLQEALRRHVRDGHQYDFIWVDAPASLGRLTISLLMAATEVVMCLKPGTKELRGAKVVAEKIDGVREAYQERMGANPHLSWIMVNEAKKSESQGKFYMRQHRTISETYGDIVLPVLRTTSVVPEAYEAQEPLMFWEPKHEAVKIIDQGLDQMGFPPAA